MRSGFVRAIFGIVPSIFLILVSAVSYAEVESECVRWFNGLKLDFKSVDCKSRCSASAVDLGTFICTDRCDELCSEPVDCTKFRQLIDRSFTDTAPKSWDEKTEKLKKWTKSEKVAVAEAMAKLPIILVEKNRFKLHRMDKSVHPGSPAAAKAYSVAIFDSAFKSKVPLARILAHELAHVYWNGLGRDEQKPYRIAANWYDDISGKLVLGRSGDTLVEPDGGFEISEDFANNVEYLLFAPAKLKSLLPSLFAWFQSSFGANFVVGDKCAEKSR